MSATGVFTVGRDGSIVISVAGFGNVTPPLGTMFRGTPKYAKKRSIPLNSPPIEYELPDGWEWEIGLDRSNRQIDDLASAIESNYWNGGTIGQCTLTQYVSENDGSTSTYSYAAGSLRVETGQFQGDDLVKQKLMGFSPTRRKVS